MRSEGWKLNLRLRDGCDWRDFWRWIGGETGIFVVVVVVVVVVLGV